MDSFGTTNLRQRGSYERTLTTSSPTNASFHDIGYQRTPQQHDWSQKFTKLTKVLGEEIHTASHAASQLFHSPLFHSHSPSNHSLPQQNNNSAAIVSNILLNDDPYHIKCEDLSKICLSCSSRELVDIFPLLVHNIFGFFNTRGWSLHAYSPRAHPYEYNPIYNFLAPSGCLFKIIDKLMQDQEAVFNFPYESLPPGIIELIDKGQIPLWYERKLFMITDKQIVAKFNAQEYFFACFAHFVRHQNTLRLPSQWSGVEDVLYVRLFEDYLKNIFPIDEHYVNNSQSPVLSNVYHSPVTHSTHKSDIWKSSQIFTHLNNTPRYNSHVLHTPSKAECFLQIFCDFWLSLNTEQYIIKQQDCKLPSSDHARMVRILVKYLHLFVNQQEQATQTFSTDNSSKIQLQEFKDSVIPALLYEKLFFYLQRCFKHWQLDSSFRMVLETWLSFIQPWRYISKNISLSDENVDLDLANWRKFIEDNLMFYTTFLQMFFIRAVRYDLKSVRDVQLIYRVAKVFSQPTLCDLLRKESESLSPSSKLGTKMMIPSPRRVHFDSPISTNPTSLFAPDTVTQARELCQILATTIIGVRHKIISSTDDNQKRQIGFIARVKDFFMIDDDPDLLSKQRDDERLIEYLQQTLYMLSAVFKFPAFETVANRNSLEPSDSVDGRLPRPDAMTTNGNTSSMPDYVISENGVELTDRGRFQIIQGLRQFNIIYSGDPELQPVRSYESAAAVRFWYKIARKINDKYGAQIEDVYKRQDFIGSSLRRVSKRLEHTHFMNNPISLPQQQHSSQPNERLKPRVSLRFAGSYYFMGYFCWVMILCRLFGFPWLYVLFTMLLIWIASVLYHVDTPPKQ